MKARDRHGRVRLAIAQEAARLMYREGVSQYFDAKRIAARRILGRDARGAVFRPGELPSNGEIRAALLALVALSEGPDRDRRLAAMRIEALCVLEALAPWHPRLIGSVWSGHARRGSDIDVHVFTEDIDRLELALCDLGWTFERAEVLIRMGNDFRAYQHLHVGDRPFPVELSVYPLAERRVVTRSSTDGEPIDRVSAKRLQARIEAAHPEAWARWQRTRELELDGLDDALPGEFDGLLPAR